MSRFVDDFAELHLSTHDLRRALEYWVNSRIIGERVEVRSVVLKSDSKYPVRLTLKCADEKPKAVAEPRAAVASIRAKDVA